MRKSQSNFRPRLARAGIATGAVAAVVFASATPALAAAVVLTLSQASGPSGGGNTITGTATAAPTPPFASTNYAQFNTAATCPATYVATVASTVLAVPAASFKVLSPTKVAVTVPSGVVTATGAASTKWNLCIYSGNTVAAGAATPGSPLVGSAAYTVAAAPTVVAASGNFVNPNSAPALGGTRITVAGTNFPATGLTATIGGSALTNIVINSSTSFSATVPAHAAGTNLPLVVTTTGGSVTKTNAFSYANGITISPNTAQAGATVDLDVQGVGFSGYTFAAIPGAAGTASTDPTAHVFLVDGDYDSTPATIATDRNLPPLAECVSILPVNDTELICSLDLTNSLATDGTANSPAAPVGNGTYTITVVNNGAVSASTAPATAATYQESVVSSGSTFTVAPF